MGKKAEAGTPKAIANAMKAKGLQRLRWYCQVCQKQCRDENAFKQHSLSEGHVRQMLVVGEHAGSYINQYSQQFQHDFLQLLSRRWGTKRVRANQVYQEYIQDKNHAHMNATRWVTLTGFCQYLGRAGICHVDETEKGWFIAWIDNSPKALAKQDAAKKKERQDMGDEQRQRKLLEEQMARTKALEAEAGTSGSQDSSDDEPEEEDIDIKAIEPIKLTIGGVNSKGKEREVEAGPAEAVENKEAAVAQENGETEKSASPAANSTNSISVSAPSIQKPRVNPLKLAGKPNPLKSNPLKAPKSTPADPSSAGTKRPLSAMEAIIAEETEKKRRREQSTWSGSRGHGKEGLQRR